MEPIFDRAGQAVAWRLRDVLYNGSGAAVGFVRQHAIYTTDGRCLGRYESGIYRDHHGALIAFEREANGGPLLPVTQPLPVPPRPELRPLEPPFQAPPPAPMRKMNWSSQSWDSLLVAAAPRSAVRSVRA